MKQFYIYLLLLSFIPLISCGEKPLEPGKYRIVGKVTGLENGELYMISDFDKPADVITVKNGRFSIENGLKEPATSISIYKDAADRNAEPTTFLRLFVEPVVMNLELDYSNFSKSVLSGSSAQNDQYKIDELRENIANDYKKEQELFRNVGDELRKAYESKASEEEIKRLKYKDNEARGLLAPMWDKQNEATLQFVKDNPKSFASVQSFVFLLRDLKYEEAKPIFDQFNSEHLNSGFAVGLEQQIEDMRKGIPGAKAGDFDTKDVNGNPIKLADFKGKYLLIDFWASWCVPCRKGNPHLIELYKKYNPKGLEILGVANDDFDKKAWRKAIKTDNIGIWHHVLTGIEIDPETRRPINPHKNVNANYNISTLPTKILVNPEGVIIGRYGTGGTSDADMDADLVRIFGG